ncbi:MAG: ATP-binding protein [Acidobacteriota bacterium]
MIIDDDGSGFDADEVLNRRGARSRFGFLGIRERVALVGGSVSIESNPGNGTTLYVCVPLDQIENGS